MEAKRTELTPILLFGFSAVVLVTSLFAYLSSQSARQQAAKLDIDSSVYPERKDKALYWPAADYAPVDLSTVPAELPNENQAVLGITVPSFQQVSIDDSIWKITSDDLAFEPLVGDSEDAEQLVIYLPAQPVISAASPRYFLVASNNQYFTFKNWTIFGWDSLAAIKQSGSWWTSNVSIKINGRIALSNINKLASTNIRARNKAVPDLSVLPLASPTGNILQPTRVAEAPQVEEDLTIRSYLLKGTKGTLFPIPLALADQLDRLAENPEAAGWAWSLAYRLDGLTHNSDSTSDAIQRSLTVVANAADEAYQQAEETKNQQLATELRRAHYAIDRRVAAWKTDISRRNQLIATSKQRKVRGLEVFGANQLEELRFAMRGDIGDVLPRVEINAPPQRQPLTLAAKLEAFEIAPSAERANDIAQRVAMLQGSKVTTDQELASAINENYRNANMRIAISNDLIKRLYGNPTTKSGVVKDRIAGRQVRGSSQTTSKVNIRTIPDEHAWRLGIHAAGSIQSDTVSFGGPAKLRTVGKTSFNAKKNLAIDFSGVKVEPTKVVANRESSRLIGISTKYDRMPMMGSYARSTAKKEYNKARGRVKQEVERKTEARIRTTIDQKTDPAIEKMQARYRELVVDRAERLGLEVDPIELRTTESRLIGRLRLANDGQLAAHTPRMRAPSDSLLSVQLHESVINNAAEGLQLEGNKFTNLQLHKQIQERFDIQTDDSKVDPSNRVTLTFQDTDAARVDFQEGQVRLTLSLRQMSIRGKKYKNLKVHTHYVPQVIDGKAWLVQEGSAQIEGKIRPASRLRLHASLGKVLGEGRKVPMLRLPADADPKLAERLAGVATTQFVIEDGWLGIALGPERSAKLAIRVGRYVR